MTDKQIIIDGVDVSRCEFFETKAQVMQCHMGALTQRCKANNCHYKQLKHKEQECEELKAELELFKTSNQKTIDNLKAENEEFKRQLEVKGNILKLTDEAKNEYSEENKQLKKENEALRRIVDGVDKLKQYDVDVEDYILINPKTSYIDGISLDESMKLKQENKTLKDRWQKLKEFIEQFKEYDPVEADLAWKIAEKMKELEGEKDAKN